MTFTPPHDAATDLTVVLLDGAAIAKDLTVRLGAQVLATRADDHLQIAAKAIDGGASVVGLSAVPWPRFADLHEQGSRELHAYTGVVSWHGLPALLDRLAEAIGPGVRQGAHVLVTAPDPGPALAPEDATFLPQMAEGINHRVPMTRRSIAWRGTTRKPTALDALVSLVDAHDRRDILEVPVAPGTGADPALLEEADRLGARLTCVDLGRSTQLDLLADVVRTVVDHEFRASEA